MMKQKRLTFFMPTFVERRPVEDLVKPFAIEILLRMNENDWFDRFRFELCNARHVVGVCRGRFKRSTKLIRQLFVANAQLFVDGRIVIWG